MGVGRNLWSHSEKKKQGENKYLENNNRNNFAKEETKKTMRETRQDTKQDKLRRTLNKAMLAKVRWGKKEIFNVAILIFP